MLRSREKLHRSQSSLTCARRFTVVLICFPGLAHQNFRDVKSWSARCNALQRPSVKLRGETRTCQACGAENEAEQITACFFLQHTTAPQWSGEINRPAFAQSYRPHVELQDFAFCNELLSSC